jgi:hypothetical protein
MTQHLHRSGKMGTLTNDDPESVREFVNSSLTYAIEWIEDFAENGSGWSIAAVEFLDLRIDWYNPARGGSYMPSPEWISAKKCCINIQNEDNNCFKYAVTASIERPERNPQRVGFYKKLDLFKFTGIAMPAPATDATFKRFEALHRSSSRVFLDSS